METKEEMEERKERMNTLDMEMQLAIATKLCNKQDNISTKFHYKQ
jgi:hypothetical protein